MLTLVRHGWGCSPGNRGLLMGVGAILAFGCNIGGFFSTKSALSLSGLGMMLGLGAGVFLLFGAVFGVVFQRPRFCLVRAFREPFMTGDAEHTRAAALALVVSTLGFAILKFADLKDRGEWVFPGAGAGALARLGAAQTGLLQKPGVAVFLPSVLGWSGAIGSIVAVALAWAILATWNEESRPLSAI